MLPMLRRIPSFIGLAYGVFPLIVIDPPRPKFCMVEVMVDTNSGRGAVDLRPLIR